MSDKLIIYKTTICATCNTAIKRLDAAGLPYTVVNVEEDPAAAQRLKDAGMERAPVFGWRGKLRTIVDLPTIERELKAQHDKKEND